MERKLRAQLCDVSFSDENISIILGMMKKLEKDFQDLLENGTLVK